MLGLSRYAKSWLVNLFELDRRRAGGDGSRLFPSPDAPGLLVDSIVELPTAPSEDLWSVDALRRRREPLEALLDGSGRPTRKDLALMCENANLREVLALPYRRTRDRIERFPEYGLGESLSLLHVAERLEHSVWKAGKSPASSFLIHPDALEEALRAGLRIAGDYKRSYLLRDLGYGSYKYVLFGYEQALGGVDLVEVLGLLRSDADEDDGLAIHREHVFPQSSGAWAGDGLGGLWMESGRICEDWIWSLGNIALPEPVVRDPPRRTSSARTW